MSWGADRDYLQGDIGLELAIFKPSVAPIRRHLALVVEDLVVVDALSRAVPLIQTPSSVNLFMLE